MEKREKKKLPFKPTALRARERGGEEEEEDGLALFQRAREMEAVERRRVRGKGEAKRGGDGGVCTSAKRRVVVDEEEDVVGSTPKRRVDLDDDDDDIVASTPAKRRVVIDDDDDDDIVASTPAKRRVVIDDDDDDDAVASTPAKSRVIIDDDDIASTPKRRVIDNDDALASTPKRRAIDNDDAITSTPAKSQNTTADNPPPSPQTPVLIADDPPSPLPPDSEFDKYILLAQAAAPALPCSFAAHILITSPIPASTPVRFKVLLDQPLRHVAAAWARHQAAASGLRVQPPIVLTWRRARVYHSSSLLDLGFRPPPMPLDDLVPETRVHFEAWSQALFHQMEDAPATLAPPSSTPHHHSVPAAKPEQNAVEPTSPSPPVQIQRPPTLRITLRARNSDPVGLSVRPETSVETLATAYRTRLGLASDTAFTIWFDGQQLHEHVTINDADIDDLDVLEVHF